jgi:hypothetical protein
MSAESMAAGSVVGLVPRRLKCFYESPAADVRFDAH